MVLLGDGGVITGGLAEGIKGLPSRQLWTQGPISAKNCENRVLANLLHMGRQPMFSLDQRAIGQWLL